MLRAGVLHYLPFVLECREVDRRSEAGHRSDFR